MTHPPLEPTTYLKTGILQLEAKQFNSALLAFQEVLKTTPTHPEALNYIHQIFIQKADYQAGLAFFEKQASLAPCVESYFSLGSFYALNHQLREAVPCFQKALQQNPQHGPSFVELGKLFFGQNKPDYALEYFLQAQVQSPKDTETLFYLGLTYFALEQFEDALKALQTLIRIQPAHSRAHHQMGLSLLALNNPSQAFIAFERALKLDETLDHVYHAMGEHFQRQRQWRLATGCFKLVLRGIHFTKPFICLKLASCYEEESDILDARYFYQKALEHQPQNPLYRYLLNTLYPRIIFRDPEETHTYLTHYYKGTPLIEQVPEAYLADNLAHFSLPYYATIHSPNPTEMLKSVGQFFRMSAPGKPPFKKKGAKKIGVISSFLYNHSLLRLFLPLLQALSQSEHQLICYYLTPDHEDEFTQSLKEISTFVPLESLNVKSLVQTLRQEKLDIALYLELGMDTLSYFIAAHRVAARQYTLPGHPMTSGLNTVDYFISAEGLSEPDHHTEKVLYLPELPIYYTPLPQVPAHQFDAPTLIFPHSLHKWTPRCQHVILDILAQAPEAECVVFRGEYNHWHAQVQEQLISVAPELSQRIHFYPKAGFMDYLSYLKGAHVVLDSIETHGSHTSYESLCQGTPVVSLEGTHLKQKIGSHLLNKLGLRDACVATSDATYTQKTLALLKPDQQALIREHIQTHSHLIFEQGQGIHALLTHFSEGTP